MASLVLRITLRFLLPLLLLAALFAWVVWQGINQWMNAPLQLPAEGVIYEVRAGASVRAVFMDFQRLGYVRHAEPMAWYLRVRGERAPVRSGEYRIPAGSTPRTLLQLFASGAVIEYSLTIPEGWTLQQALHLIQAQDKLVHRLSTPVQVAAALSLAQGQSPEGWVFPDTYRYEKGMSDADILRVAHRKMVAVLDREWQQRDPVLPYATPYEALVMASIVEKETGMAEERAEIAGVFVRRLQAGMRLQTDPTVIYGLGERYDGNLTRAHLQEPGPYNTYLNAGLPPTPIALPGEAAIHAALHPQEGKSLYFVARGDGTHVFSESLGQHAAAVNQYQVRMRSGQYHSRPIPPGSGNHAGASP